MTEVVIFYCKQLLCIIINQINMNKDWLLFNKHITFFILYNIFLFLFYSQFVQSVCKVCLFNNLCNLNMAKKHVITT